MKAPLLKHKYTHKFSNTKYFGYLEKSSVRETIQLYAPKRRTHETDALGKVLLNY